MIHCVVWRSIARLLRESETDETPHEAKRRRRLVARPRKASGMLRKTTVESQCQMKKARYSTIKSLNTSQCERIWTFSVPLNLAFSFLKYHLICIFEAILYLPLVMFNFKPTDFVNYVT